MHIRPAFQGTLLGLWFCLFAVSFCYSNAETIEVAAELLQDKAISEEFKPKDGAELNEEVKFAVIPRKLAFKTPIVKNPISRRPYFRRPSPNPRGPTNPYYRPPGRPGNPYLHPPGAPKNPYIRPTPRTPPKFRGPPPPPIYRRFPPPHPFIGKPVPSHVA